MELADFETATRQVRLRPGEGLPGRVWESGASAWILDVRGDANFPRRDAAASSGVKKGLSFNSRGRSSGVAVAEFQIPSKPGCAPGAAPGLAANV